MASRDNHHADRKKGVRHSGEEGTRSRLLPVRGYAAARGAHHSVGHQQAALCHVDRHQECEEQAAAQGGDGRSEVRPWRKSAENRTPLHSAEDEEDRAYRRASGRNREETGRQTTQRAARAVIILSVGKIHVATAATRLSGRAKLGTTMPEARS